jgi:uncharacterized lipoprotein YbaY
LRIEIAFETEERPPVGAPLHVRVLDTSYADAPARVLAEVSTEIEAAAQEIDVDFSPPSRGPDEQRVFAHVDVDRDGAVSAGDFLTTAAHPVRGEERVRVVLRRI